MTDQESSPNQPAPKGRFGHPITEIAKSELRDHKPGFEEASREHEEAERDAVPGRIVPKRGPHVPRTSLAERLRQRLEEQGEKP